MIMDSAEGRGRGDEMTGRPGWMLAVPNLVLFGIGLGMNPFWVLVAAIVLLANVSSKNIET